MELIFCLFYIFVCVLSLTTAEDGNGTCEALCITIIGVIVSALILSVPLIIVVYFLTKLLMRMANKCLIKQKLRRNVPRLSIYELGEVKRRMSHTNEVKNSTTMLEMIAELPETTN